MKGLKCTTCNCEHNVNCHCLAGIINIDDHAVCTTKQKRSMGILEQNKVNLEAGKDFSFEENDDVFIVCDTLDCQYNKNHSCSSPIVNIQDCILKTKCKTKEV